MKCTRALLIAVLIIVSLVGFGWIAHRVAPLVSDQWASAVVPTVHFRITATEADEGLARRVAVVLESEYQRVSGALGHQLREPLNVRVTSSRLVYNLSCGIPVPTPPGDGFDGAAGDRGVTIMLPRHWKLGEEKEIPDRGRSVAIHEVTHMLVFDMNPAVLQKRWLNEGVVWHLSIAMDTPAMRRLDNSWMGDDLQRGAVPKLSDIATNDQKNWQVRKGDLYSRQFIAFVAQNYGKEKIPAMVRSAQDLRQELGKDEAGLYPEWLDYLKLRQAADKL